MSSPDPDAVNMMSAMETAAFELFVTFNCRTGTLMDPGGTVVFTGSAGPKAIVTKAGTGVTVPVLVMVEVRVGVKVLVLVGDPVKVLDKVGVLVVIPGV